MKTRFALVFVVKLAVVTATMSFALAEAQAQTGVGYALSFSETNQCLSATIPRLASNYTMAGWVFLRAGGSLAGTNCVGVLTGTNCGNSVEMLVGSTNGSSTGSQFLQLDRCGYYTAACSTNPVPTNQWVHLAITVSTNRLVSYFINGVASGTWDGSSRVTALGSEIHLADNSLGNRQFNGLLDEFQIWSCALSAGEIQANMYRTPNVADTNLVAYWPFEEGGRVGTLGGRTADASGKGCVGKLAGRPQWRLSTVPRLLAPQLLGADRLTNECHTVFTDPGATFLLSPAILTGGDQHSLALKADGTIRVWGKNTYGQLNAPASATNVVSIAAGMYHSVVLKGDGTVLNWGDNYEGQLNGVESATNAVAIAAGASHNLALKANGTIIGWGNNTHGQATAPASATNVVAIAAGAYHSLALKADGTVLTWGDSGSGRLNVPASATNVAAIAAGYYYSLALKPDRTILAWGINMFGETNVPVSATNVAAIASGLYHCLALKGDGTIVSWGDNTYGQINVPASATNIIAIAAGNLNSVAVKADGTILAWGRNDFGQSDLPADLNVAVPAAVSGAVDANSPGTYILSYIDPNRRFTGSATRTVVVEDTTAPAITLHGQNPMAVTSLGSSFTDPGATAYDACSGTLLVNTDGGVNVNVPGIYTITYTASDSHGHSVTNNRTVYVGMPAVTATLVNKWSFEGNPEDSSGHGNHGTITGSPCYVPGKFGQGIYLHRFDQVANLAAADLPVAGEASWSYNLWLYLTNAPDTSAYLAGFGNCTSAAASGTARGLIAYGGPNNRGIYSWGSDSSSRASDLVPGVGFPLNQWVMVTITHDGTTGTRCIWTNGVSIASAVRPLTNAPSSILVGGAVWPGAGFQGIVDEFTIWSGALRSDDIANLYASNTLLMPSTNSPELSVTAPTNLTRVAWAQSQVSISGIGSNLFGLIAWTNTQARTNGWFLAGQLWTAPEVLLLPGTNWITFCASNIIGQNATASIQVVRNGLDLPAIATTNYPATCAASVAFIQGTANDQVAGRLCWTNAANGTRGSIPANTAWAMRVEPLAAGENNITVVATNALGISASATITVQRPEFVTHYVSKNGRHVAPYLSWDTAATDIQSAINAAVDGDEVLVAPGTYSQAECLSITNSIVLRAADLSHPPVVSIAGIARCLYLSNQSALVEGFILAHGYQPNGMAAGVYSLGGTLENCVITGCYSKSAPCGIWCQNTVLRHCTIANNLTYYWDAGAGFSGSGNMVENCIIYYNFPAGQTSGQNCAGTGNTFLNCCTVPAQGTNCITAEPGFINRTAEDFRLRWDSPCLDTGMGLTLLTDSSLGGTVRPQDGNLDGAAISDIGAYEYNPKASDFDGDGVSDYEELLGGTDPYDKASIFKITVTNTLQQILLSVPSSTRCRYTLMTCTNLSLGAWEAVTGQSAIAGTGSPLTFSVTHDTPTRFFRIAAEAATK